MIPQLHRETARGPWTILKVNGPPSPIDAEFKGDHHVLIDSLQRAVHEAATRIGLDGWITPHVRRQLHFLGAECINNTDDGKPRLRNRVRPTTLSPKNRSC